MQRDSPIKLLNDFARRNKVFTEYRLENESGPAHAKMFTVRLHMGEKTYVATGRSIKLAQRTAAQIALHDCRNLLLTNNRDGDISQINVFPSPVFALNNWANRNGIAIQYVLLNDQHPTSPNRSRAIIYYRLYLGHDLYFDGHGLTHQQARTNCALNAFYFLRQNQVSPPSTPQSPYSSSSPKTSKASKSEISVMYDRAKQLGLPVRMQIIDAFTITYHIGEKYSATGKGFNHHVAKQNAAEKLLDILSKIDTTPNPITRVYQLAQLRQVKVEFLQLDSEENFHYQIKFGDNEQADGSGKSKQLAKRSAAERLLEKLTPVVALPPPPAKGLLKREGNNENAIKNERKHVHFVEDAIEKDELNSSTRSIPSSPSSTNKQKLMDACQKCNIQIEYVDEMSKNANLPSSRYQSIVSLSTTDRLLAQFRGHGPSLARAQENASSAAWNNLKQLFHDSVPNNENDQ